MITKYLVRLLQMQANYPEYCWLLFFIPATSCILNRGKAILWHPYLQS